jgi:hypothetical protein
MNINIKILRDSGEEKGDEIILENLVIIDDLFSQVQDKIFYSDDFSFKNLLKYELVIKDKEKGIENNIFLNEEKQLLFYLNESHNLIDYEYKIKITSIFDIIKDDFYSLYFLGNDSPTLIDVYDKYKVEYLNLTRDDLWYCIMAHVHSTDDIQYRIGDTSESVSEYFDEFVKYLSNYHQEVKNRMEVEYNDLKKYYFNVKNLKIYNFEPMIKYNLLNIEYQPFDFISGVKGRFIDLVNIFNTLELTTEIPFISINGKLIGNETAIPISRIYNNTIATEEEIKLWKLKEKKKDSIFTYKKISGLLLKYKIKSNNNYLSIYLNESGKIKVVWDNIHKNNDIKLEYNFLLKYIRECVQKILDVVNKLKNVFKYSKTLTSLNFHSEQIKSLDSIISIPTFIYKFDFAKLLNNATIIHSLFSQKDTVSLDHLYLYYLKLGTEENRISLSIKDNLYEKGSIINIYNVKNSKQIEIIILQLLYIYNTLDELNDTQEITEKGRIKDLRAAGVEISSVKCQSGKQPLIGEEGDQAFEKLKQKLPDIYPPLYQVEYKNIKYTCPTILHPYVGINTNNGICCFKRDQRQKTEYIRILHPDLINIDVQPSNFKIKVTENDITFETYVIKVVYSLENDYKYHFINSENKFIPIINEDLINSIETADSKFKNTTIWLETIPIYKLTNNPPMNQCKALPNIDNKSNDNINKPCEHLKEEKYFGYNSNSYPCCFPEKPSFYTTLIEKKKTDVFKKDIIHGDKILDNNRLGTLHPNLKTLFNKYLKRSENGIFYRLGVTQGKYALLNTLINTGLTNHTNPFEIINDIEKYLTENMDVFISLNNGYILNKFKQNNQDNNHTNTLSRYMYYLKTSIINPIDIIDILQILFKINIHILSIPLEVTQYKKEFLYDDIKYLCKKNIKSNYNLNIILIKRSHYYEIISHASFTEKVLTMSFNNNEKCIEFLNHFNEATCITNQMYPSNYKYAKLYTFEELQIKLENTSFKIISQITSDNYVELLLIKKKGLKTFFIIPIYQKGITIEQNIKNFTLQSIIKSDIMTLSQTIEQIPDLQKIFPEYHILGYTVDNNKTVTSFLSSYGVHIPVKKEMEGVYNNIKRLDYKYYLDIDNNKNNDELDSYIRDATLKYNTMLKGKTMIGEIFSKNENIKQNVMETVLDIDMSRTQKFIKIKNILTQMNINFLNDIYLSDITNEILNDNIENNLLSNVIVMSHIDPSKIIIRDSESILMTMDDILNWIRNFKKEQV